ncbi:PREDICTED: hemicentin-1-like [Priapulus caudatus]|uniref:Hemicentin-1-like n=1 Tax=Priapulus caudatus TaxID=37621 RepID=A0ABM1FA88_PRICU|nr:PREDICTED: hemicentin-1-like [Priapulus caudatus]
MSWNTGVALLLLTLDALQAPTIFASTGLAQVTVRIEPQPVQENTSVVLTCDYLLPEGQELIELTWKKDGVGIYRLRRNGQKRVLGGTPIPKKRMDLDYQPESSLRILEAKAGDSGMYQCIVGYGDDVYGSSELVVIVPPDDPVIVSSAVEGIVKEFDLLTLTCEADGGKPPANVTWWYKGAQMEEAVYKREGKDTSRGLGRSTLTIEVAATDDGESYQCQAWNIALRPESPKTTEITLDVSYTPEASISKERERVQESGSVQATCRLKAKPQTTDIQWTKDGTVIEQYEATMLLEDIKRQDAGEYRCVGRNVIGWGRESEPFILEVTYAPFVTMLYQGSEMPSSIATEGETLQLTCDADANPTPEYYRWTKDGSDIGENSHTYFVPVLTRQHKGTYQCTASNEAGHGTSELFVLDIEYKPVSQIVNSIGISPLIMTESEQSTLTLTCEIDANPIVKEIQWYKDGEAYLQNEANKVILEYVRREDAGQYSCQGSNMIGWGQKSNEFELIVQYKPDNVVVEPSRMTLYDGDMPENIYCKANGFPEPQFRWLRNGVVEAEGPELKLLGNTMTRERGGIYTCAVSNAFGETRADAVINVLHAPVCVQTETTFNAPVNEKVVLRCEVYANPPEVTFEWTVDGQEVEDDFEDGQVSSLSVRATRDTEFRDYHCRATNRIGTAHEPCIIHFRKMSEPQVVRTCEYETTPVNIFIQCAKGQDGGSAQHFLLFRNNEEVAKNPQPIFNISVEPGRTYEINIFAKNDIGMSSSYPLMVHTPKGGEEPQLLLSGGAIFGIVIVILIILVIIAAIILIVMRKKKRQNKGAYNINGADRKEPVNQNLLTTRSDDIEAGFLPPDAAKDGEDKNQNKEKSEKSKADFKDASNGNKENGPTPKTPLATGAPTGKNKKVYLPPVQHEHVNHQYEYENPQGDTDSEGRDRRGMTCDDDDDDDCLVVYADLDLPQCNSTPKPAVVVAADEDAELRTPYSTIDFSKRPPSPIQEVAEDENANEVTTEEAAAEEASGEEAAPETTDSTAEATSVEEEYKQQNPHTVIV